MSETVKTEHLHPESGGIERIVISDMGLHEIFASEESESSPGELKF